LDGHALAHDPLQAEQADPELVLQQLADRTDAAVAEVVDVVDVLAALDDLDEVADDADEILAREVSDRLLLDATVAVLDLLEPGCLDVEDGELLLKLAIELVAPDRAQIVALLVEKRVAQQRLGVVDVLRLARAEFLVELLESVFARLDVLVFLQTVEDDGRHLTRARIREQRLERLVAFVLLVERTHERGRHDLAVLVDAHADRALGRVVLAAVVRLEFDPGTTVGDDCRAVDGPAVGVCVGQEIDAG